MRVLVVGSLPPPSGGHRDALLGEVLRRRELGQEVEVVALDRLAVAHRYLSAPGLPGVIELALVARGAKTVILQLEPGLPVRHSAARAERSLALIALARLLRKRDEVVLRINHFDDLPGGPGGRAANELWGVATRIEVSEPGLAEALAAVVGPHADRIVVAGAYLRPTATGIPGPASWGEGAEATAERVQAVVRRRAAEQRQALGKRGHLPMPGGGLEPRVSQWPLLPAPGAGVPDLGPAYLDRDKKRRFRLQAPPSVSRVLHVAIARAETWSVTRPFAHLGRFGWSEAKAVGRRLVGEQPAES
ncbi:MAG: hypothetical protein ACRD0Z_13630 [Acidimicrobiales bacterium]